MDTAARLRWYDIDYIVAVAGALGLHVRGAWVDQGGEYGANLPAELVAGIERVDWRRVTPAEYTAMEVR